MRDGRRKLIPRIVVVSPDMLIMLIMMIMLLERGGGSIGIDSGSIGPSRNADQSRPYVDDPVHPDSDRRAPSNP
jgi:hypothetical protein